MNESLARFVAALRRAPANPTTRRLTMHTRQTPSFAAILAGFALAACLSVASATTYNWTPTGGSGLHWPTTSQDNWGTGVGGGYPNAAGDVANLAVDNIAAININLNQSITIGALVIGDTNASTTNYSTAINAGVPVGSLTFDSGLPGVSATLTLSSSGTPTNTISAGTSLSSNLLIDLAGIDASNRQRLTLTGVMATNGNTLTVVNGILGQSRLNFGSGSDFSGPGTIVNNSNAVIDVTGSKTFAGTLVANGYASESNQSSFTFTNGGFPNAAEMVVNGSNSNSNVRGGGGLQAGSGSTFANNPGQRFSTNRISMNSGFLVNIGQPATVGIVNDWQQGLEWVVDNVAVFDFNSGYNYLSIGAGANTQGTRMNVATLERGGGASVYMFGVNDANKNFLVGNSGDFLIGAGGADGSTTKSIIPWVSVYAGGGFANPAGFATYDAITGIRALDVTTEYATAINAGAAHNVSTNNVTLASAATVNSLRFTGGSSNIGAGQTLTIASGGVFFTGGGTIGASGNAAAGTLDFGSAEGVVSVHANNIATIGAAITGNAGLTKANTGILILTGMNVYSGLTHISGGTVQVGNGTYDSNLGSGDVHVHNGALLDIRSADAIADGATLVLDAFGLHNGRVSIAGGLVELVGALSLGGVLQAGGYYGSASAAAANPGLSVFVNETFFSGLGLVEVPIPEPGSGLLALLGVLGLAGRRRRRG